MGKRKKSSRKPQGPRKNEPLPTNFTCLFCNHEKAVAVKIDKKNGIGYLDCKVCGQKFQSQVNALSAPVDVYGDWVDAADSVAKEDADGGGPSSSMGSRGMMPRGADGEDERYEGDGIVGDDEFD